MPRFSLPLPTGITKSGTFVRVSNTVTWPTSRLLAYIRLPSGVTASTVGLFGNGAVAITELLLLLISVIPPSALLTYTIGGRGRIFPVFCATAGPGPTDQAIKVISTDRSNHS